MVTTNARREQLVLGLITLLVGLVSAKLALTGEYAALVKRSMRPWLWLAGAILCVMGSWTLLSYREQHQHSHHRPALIGSLLVIPMALLCVLPTPNAGLYLAKRGAQRNTTTGVTQLTPLPAGQDIQLELDDYVLHAVSADAATTMTGKTFHIVGFVVNQGVGNPWQLSRLKVNCCVADALPFRLVAQGAAAFPDNLWVEVQGTWLPSSDGQARMNITRVVPIEVPAQPMLS
ncbi:MAG: TIGR03943 family putative permease subunit [Propionibacteriaceae bacterium]